MCAVSMIMNHYGDKWRRRPQPPMPRPPHFIPSISPEEVAEFRELLDRAREYDKQHNQSDCELDAKRQEILDLAKKHGVEISFL